MCGAWQQLFNSMYIVQYVFSIEICMTLQSLRLGWQDGIKFFFRRLESKLMAKGQFCSEWTHVGHTENVYTLLLKLKLFIFESIMLCESCSELKLYLLNMVSLNKMNIMAIRSGPLSNKLTYITPTENV